MKSFLFYGYEFEITDLLSTVGSLFAVGGALIAVFWNHYFSMRRLRIELNEQDKQRELDRLSRLQEERLNSHLHQMERLFEFTLELKSICEQIRDGLNKVDDINAAFDFSELFSKFADDIREIDNKMRVILNVYFHDDLLDIDILFISGFPVELITQSSELRFLDLEMYTSEDKALESLSLKKNNFESILDCFVEDICYLEKEFVEKIESEHENLYNKR